MKEISYSPAPAPGRTPAFTKGTPRPMIRVVRSLMLALVIALPLAGCASTETVQTTPEPVTVTVQGGQTEDQATTEAEDTTTEEAESRGAGIGDTIEVAGSEDGASVAVTVLKVVDPAPYEAYLGPQKGNRYVGIKLQLHNTGSVYDDCPLNGSALIDAQDQEWTEPALGSALKPDFVCLKIQPSDKRVGYVSFEVPKRARLRTFQFGTESGFGPEAGEWSLR